MNEWFRSAPVAARCLHWSLCAQLLPGGSGAASRQLPGGFRPPPGGTRERSWTAAGVLHQPPHPCGCVRAVRAQSLGGGSWSSAGRTATRPQKASNRGETLLGGLRARALRRWLHPGGSGVAAGWAPVTVGAPFGPTPGADKVQLGSAAGVCIRRRRGLRPRPGGSGVVAGRRSPVGHRQPPPCISKNDADDNFRGFGSQGLPHPTLSPFQGWANHASLSGSGFSGFGADILHPLPEMGAPGRCCCAARERARLPPQAAQVLISLVFRQCVPVQRRCVGRVGGRPSGTHSGPVWSPACMATGSWLVCVGGDAASHTSVESMGLAHRSAATTAGCKRGGQAAGPHFDSRAHPR